jgi:hypothetical protein
MPEIAGSSISGVALTGAPAGQRPHVAGQMSAMITCLASGAPGAGATPLISEMGTSVSQSSNLSELSELSESQPVKSEKGGPSPACKARKHKQRATAKLPVSDRALVQAGLRRWRNVCAGERRERAPSAT